MPEMAGSSTFKKMCGSDPKRSVVKQCQNVSLILPTSSQCTQAIHSICNQMAMDGCDKCIFSF
jgi:hypothetical protein